MESPASEQKKHLCRNCLTPVQGGFCAHCGQKHHASVRPFSQVVGEFFTDVLNFDSKIIGTLRPLLFRPGMLSNAYFANRRMRYVSPFKLYFFLSLMAFFLVQQNIERNINPDSVIQLNGDGSDKPLSEEFNIELNGKPWNAKTNPVAYDWIPDAGNALLNDRISRLNGVLKGKEEKKRLIHSVLAATPQALLISLPLFALILKLAYLFQKRLYIEHLIVALHNHAFLLLVMSLSVVLDVLSRWQPASSWNVLLTFSSLLLLYWIPAYFLLSLKRVYRQSWKMTIFKFLLIGFCYLFILILVLIINLILGLLML